MSLSSALQIWWMPLPTNYLDPSLDATLSGFSVSLPIFIKIQYNFSSSLIWTLWMRVPRCLFKSAQRFVDIKHMKKGDTFLAGILKLSEAFHSLFANSVLKLPAFILQKSNPTYQKLQSYVYFILAISLVSNILQSQL